MKPRRRNIYFPFFAAIIIFFVLFFSNCITDRKREEICKTCVMQQKTTDSVKTVIKNIEIPVYITDTIHHWIANPCAYLCDSLGRLKAFNKVITDDKGTKQEIYTKNNELHWRTIIDSLKKVITIRDTNTTRVITTEKEVESKCNKVHRTSFDDFCRWFFWILSAIVLAHFILKFASGGKVGLILKLFKKAT